MNKLVLDKEKNIELIVLEDSICNISKEYDINELNIVLKDNVKFVVNHYGEISENKLNITINQSNNSEFIYNHSFINNNKYDLNIFVTMSGNNSKNYIYIHGISDKGKTNIKVDGNVLENTIDNELDEGIKMLNINNGKTYVEPNMYINTKNVVANHAASISEFEKDYLFYLNSKGISDEASKKLLIDGFLKNDAK